MAVEGAIAVTVAQGANRGCGARLWWWQQWLVPTEAAQVAGEERKILK